MATTLAAAAAAFQKQAEELGAWLAAPGDAAPIKWESGLQSAFASLIERMCDADSGSDGGVDAAKAALTAFADATMPAQDPAAFLEWRMGEHGPALGADTSKDLGQLVQDAVWSLPLLRVVCAIGVHPGVQAALAQVGAGIGIAAALKDQADDPLLCIAASEALGVLGKDSDPNKNIAAGSGGTALMVELLTRHADAPLVCETVCRALASLVDDDYDNTEAMTGARAAEALVATLTKHAASAPVCAAATRAIASYMLYNSEEQGLVVGAGGVGVVLDVFGRHVDNADVCTGVCAAIDSLGDNYEAGEFLDGTEAGQQAARVVMDVMKRHKGNAEVCGGAMQVLHRLVKNRGMAQLTMLAEGGIDVVVSMLRAFPDVPEVTDPGIATLSSFTDDGEGRGALAKAGAVAPIVAAAAACPSAVGTCCAFGNAVCMLGYDAAMRAEFLELGAVDLMVAALKRHSDMQAVQYVNTASLGQLVVLDVDKEEWRERLRAVDSVESLKAFLTECGDNALAATIASKIEDM